MMRLVDRHDRFGGRGTRVGRRVGLSICLAAGLCALVQADPAEPSPDPAPSASAVPDAGFWPTPRMIDALLTRTVEAVAEQYAFDEAQYAALKEDLLARYPALFNRHRAVLQPIINEIIEMQIAQETPTAERVAEMARAVEPVLKDVRKALRGTQRKIKPLLRPEQRKRLDGDFVKIWAGFSAAETQLRRWKRGLFKPGDLAAQISPRSLDTESSTASGPDPAFDPPSKATGDGRSSRPRDPKPKRPTSTPVRRQTLLPLDKWQAYVKRFIRQRRLDEGQSNQAMALLKEIRKRGKDHTDQNRDLFQRIASELPSADPIRREKLEQDLDELRQPLRDLFDELQERLEDLLRSDQRRDSRR